MASNDASNAIDSFQPITTVIGTPTFQAINSRHRVLKQNASSVTTTLAGGNHGLLALVLSAADYTQLTQAVWIEPINPGMRPVIPAASNRVAQENITSQWKNESENYKLVQDVREALKNQILSAFDDEYLEDLKDPDTGYANITPLQMLEHLYGDYGELTQQDISENRNSIKTDYDPTTTMVSYFHNIREIRNIATRAGNPISDSDLLAELYLVMDRAGIFVKAIDDWDDLQAADKTWARFQREFKKAYKRHKEKERRQPAGVRTSPRANNAMETLASTMERHLDEYANSATVERTAIANLTTANASLVATNAELTTKMERCLLELTKLQTEVAKIQASRSRNNRGNGNRTRGGNNNDDSSTSTGTSVDTSDWKYYCWSCGMTGDRTHVSANCPNPKPGHCRGATHKKRMRGSNVGCGGNADA